MGLRLVRLGLADRRWRAARRPRCIPGRRDLAAELREAFHALALGVLHEMQLPSKKKKWSSGTERSVWKTSDIGPWTCSIQRRSSSALLTVAESPQEHVLRRVDDRLFPDRSAPRIAEVVQLVEDHAADIREFFV